MDSFICFSAPHAAPKVFENGLNVVSPAQFV